MPSKSVIIITVPHVLFFRFHSLSFYFNVIPLFLFSLLLSFFISFIYFLPSLTRLIFINLTSAVFKFQKVIFQHEIRRLIQVRKLDMIGLAVGNEPLTV